MATYDKSTQGDGLQEKIIQISRNAKVSKGGRNFSFGVVAVVGNGVDTIGYGSGKAPEVPDAILKALDSARKNLIKIPLNGNTLLHQMISTHGATKVFMKPASKGTGIIAGGAMRAIFEVLGVKDVLAKAIGSTNPINVARATIKGLSSMFEPDYIAEKRNKTLKEIVE